MSYIRRNTSSSSNFTARFGASPRPIARITSGIFIFTIGSGSSTSQIADTSPVWESISKLAPLAFSSILRVRPALPISTAMRSLGMRARSSTKAGDPPSRFNPRPKERGRLEPVPRALLTKSQRDLPRILGD